MLFSTLSTETQALLTIICTMVGGAVTWVVTRLYDWNKEKRKERLEDEDRKRKIETEDDNRTIEHLEKLIERGEKLRVEMRQDYRILEQEFRKTERIAERAVAWIVHLESLLTEHKIPHPKWKTILDAGSTEHPPLSTSEQSPGG